MSKTFRRSSTQGAGSADFVLEELRAEPSFERESSLDRATVERNYRMVGLYSVCPVIRTSPKAGNDMGEMTVLPSAKLPSGELSRDSKDEVSSHNLLGLSGEDVPLVGI